MWIKRINENTERLALPNLSKPVQFNENGKAQVPKDDGEMLIENGYAEECSTTRDDTFTTDDDTDAEEAEE